MKIQFKMLIIGGLCSMVGACAHRDNHSNNQGDSDPTSIEAKQVAAQKEAAAVTEISFAKGQSVLTPQAQKQLRDLLAKNTTPEMVDDIKVIAWADQEYPSVHTKKLSKEQRRLATDRLKKITDFIKNGGYDKDTDTINMAEQPNGLEKLFNTEDAEIKKILESVGIPNTYSKVKSHGKASKAIIMVINKD